MKVIFETSKDGGQSWTNMDPFDETFDYSKDEIEDGNLEKELCYLISNWPPDVGDILRIKDVG